MSLPEVAEIKEKRKCPKTDCITDPCPRERPPKSEDGFCIVTLTFLCLKVD